MTIHEGRRAVLRTAAGMTAAGIVGTVAVDALAAQPDIAALAAEYDVAPDFANLENGYYGIMARSVADAFKRNIDHLNRYNSYFLRREFDGPGVEAVRAQLAAHAGVAVDELALTRGACESLQNLISNYRLLKPGDAVIVGNLDYDAMLYAMQDLARRSGAGVVTVQIPEPASRENVIDTYERAMQANPRAKLMLLTHISHRTGLVLPVAEIVQRAKRRNVDVIVDVAQSYGQLDFRLPDLGADFVGGNLHKWVGAPLGTGFLYIRKSRLADISPHLGDRDYPEDDIRSRVHAGTYNAAAMMTIPAALAFHGRFTPAQRSARLRALRDYWVHRVRDLPAVQVLTPEDPAMYGAVTSFRLRGVTSFEANVALARRLADEFGVFTVARSGPAGGACVRVTPAFFTTAADLDKLVAAIRKLAGA